MAEVAAGGKKNKAYGAKARRSLPEYTGVELFGEPVNRHERFNGLKGNGHMECTVDSPACHECAHVTNNWPTARNTP